MGLVLLGDSVRWGLNDVSVHAHPLGHFRSKPCFHHRLNIFAPLAYWRSSKSSNLAVVNVQRVGINFRLIANSLRVVPCLDGRNVANAEPNHPRVFVLWVITQENIERLSVWVASVYRHATNVKRNKQAAIGSLFKNVG